MARRYRLRQRVSSQCAQARRLAQPLLGRRYRPSCAIGRSVPSGRDCVDCCGSRDGNALGVTEGQLALASKINNSRVLNVLVREYIDGVRDAAATIASMNDELAKID